MIRRCKQSGTVEKVHQITFRGTKTSTSRCKIRYRLATVWYDLEKVYRGFTNFDRNRRLSLQEAGHILRRQHERSRDLQVVNLKVSQATALEEFDARVAAGMEKHCKTKKSMTTPSNDGTNACAFISVGVAESILHDTKTEAFFENLPKAVEVTILSIPEEINEHRDMGKNYDILEAYEILRRQQLIRFPLQFSEELPYADGVFTYEGREKLFTKLCALGAEYFVAIYTSDPFVLTIGCYKGKPFMMTLIQLHHQSEMEMAYFSSGMTTPLRYGCPSACPFGGGYTTAEWIQPQLNHYQLYRIGRKSTFHYSFADVINIFKLFINQSE